MTPMLACVLAAWLAGYACAHFIGAPRVALKIISGNLAALVVILLASLFMMITRRPLF